MKDNDFLNFLESVDLEPMDDIPETGWIDTGSYILNALISGSIFGGIPRNRSTMFAGKSGVGKSYFLLSCAKQFLIDNPTGRVMYFDTEFALERSMVAKRDIDTNRFHIVQVDTLEDFRTKAVKLLDGYLALPEKNRTPIMLCLDSLSNLPTKKEVEDAASGSDKRDMTKSQVIRSIFRVITAKLGNANIPLLIANHVYDAMDMYSPVVISGGGGAIYAASTILTLNKSKHKEGTEVIGGIIRATAYKSRYTKQDQKVEMLLDYNSGLDRFWGILEIAEKFGVVKKLNVRTYELPNGEKVGSKELRENTAKYFTMDILQKVDDCARKQFALGEGDTGIVLFDDSVVAKSNEDTGEE